MPANQGSDTGILRYCSLNLRSGEILQLNIGLFYLFSMFFVFSLILTTSTVKHPDRLRVMIPLSTCWHVSGVREANTPVLLPEPWE